VAGVVGAGIDDARDREHHSEARRARVDGSGYRALLQSVLTVMGAACPASSTSARSPTGTTRFLRTVRLGPARSRFSTTCSSAPWRRRASRTSRVASAQRLLAKPDRPAPVAGPAARGCDDGGDIAAITAARYVLLRDSAITDDEHLLRPRLGVPTGRLYESLPSSLVLRQLSHHQRW
jgi:hypothetical protein